MPTVPCFRNILLIDTHLIIDAPFVWVFHVFIISNCWFWNLCKNLLCKRNVPMAKFKCTVIRIIPNNCSESGCEENMKQNPNQIEFIWCMFDWLTGSLYFINWKLEIEKILSFLFLVSSYMEVLYCCLLLLLLGLLNQYFTIYLSVQYMWFAGLLLCTRMHYCYDHDILNTDHSASRLHILREKYHKYWDCECLILLFQHVQMLYTQLSVWRKPWNQLIQIDHGCV